MDTYIYGAGQNGEKIIELIQNEYRLELQVKGFIDRQKRGKLAGIPIFRMDEVEIRNARVIIAIGAYSDATDVFKILKEEECSEIWWFYGEKKVFGKDFWIEQCISCKAWGTNMLNHVEMHIMDGCNLNCRGCAHFSPIFDKEIPDYEARICDVRRLSEKVGHIVEFHIMGGEPLLNPEIHRYVEEIKQILPDTQVCIVTNGLLIPRIGDEVLQKIQECGVRIIISEYKPTRKIMDAIQRRLEEFGIIYEIRSWSNRQKFNKPLALYVEKEESKLCISNGCVNIWNGKIARCPTLMYIEKFNEYFGTDLPSKGIMELNECPSGENLIRKLEEKVPLCDHCVKNEIEWSVCGKEIMLSDFCEVHI